MVFFTCNGCNEALKKNQVQKHKYICRRSQVVSCVDCMKDFHGEEFDAHLKCMSEDQKYGGQNYVAKENKGEVKQQRWADAVLEAINIVLKTCDNPLRRVLESVRNYPNIPQKEAKFKNFVSNSLRFNDIQLVERAWTTLSTKVMELKKQQEQKMEQNKADKSENEDATDKPEEQNAKQADAENITTVSPEKRKKVDQVTAIDQENEDVPKKRKKDKKTKESEEKLEEDIASKNEQVEPSSCENIPTSETNDACVVETPSIKSLIKRFLKQADNNELRLKRLKKMVAKEIGSRDDKKQIGDQVDAYLKTQNTKYATDGKIVRFAVES